MKLYKIVGAFSLANWAILLFYLYGYVFDHIVAAHPEGLVGVGFVAFATGCIGMVLAEEDM